MWVEDDIKARRTSHLFRARQQNGKQSHTLHPHVHCSNIRNFNVTPFNCFQWPLAFMLFVSCTDASTVEVPTYPHTYRQTGQMLTCTQCPAGTYMRAHCTPTRDTVCSPCPANHFTQYWNYLPNCLYCGTFCVENQHVKEECSPINNRVCECNDGYYWHADFCIKHTECPSGHGVEKKGKLEYVVSLVSAVVSVHR